GDERARVLGLCDAARCLVSLERDLPAAEAFVLEAEALCARVNHAEPVVLPLTRGSLCAYRGDYERARERLSSASQMARTRGDRLSEFYAVSNIVECLLAEQKLDEA